jgi:hypothetical protein
MKNIDTLKQLLKDKAEHIKRNRAEARLLKQQGQGPIASSINNGLVYSSKDYRNHHIAYCELKGKTRDQIEKPKKDNLPSEFEINRIKTLYAWTPEEITAYNERKAKREETLRANQIRS